MANFNFNLSGSNAGLMPKVANPLNKGANLGFLQAPQGTPSVSGGQVKFSTQSPTGLIQGGNQVMGNNPGLLSQTTQPQQPVKKVTNTDGSSVEYHNTQTPSTPQSPTYQYGQPVYSTQTGQKVGNALYDQKTGQPLQNPAEVAGAGTANLTPAAADRAIYQAGQFTPAESAALAAVERGIGYQNIGNLGTDVQAQDYTNQVPNEALISRPGTAGEKAADYSLYNKLANVYGTQATAALGAAQTQAARQAQTAETAAGYIQPQPYGITTTPYAPATNQFGNIAGTAAGGGLQGVGNVQGQIGIGQNVAQLNSYLGGAQVVGNNLNDLITANNINPTGLTYANGALQFGATLMSDPAYQKFAGQINDFVASLAPILGVGGNVTDMKTQMSNSIVNALQSGSTIKDVVSYFLDQAKQKIGGLSAGGGAGVGSSQGNTQSAGGYNFVQGADGQWHPQ